MCQSCRTTDESEPNQVRHQRRRTEGEIIWRRKCSDPKFWPRDTKPCLYKVPSLSAGKAGLVSNPRVISTAIPAFLTSYFRVRANRTPPLGILYWCLDPKWIQGTTGPAVGMVEKSNNDASIGFVLSIYVITGIDFTAVGEQCSRYCLSSSIPMWASCFSARSQRPPLFLCSSFMFVARCCPPVLGHLLYGDPASPPLHLAVETKKEAKINSFQLILGACELTLWFSSVVMYKHGHSKRI